MIHNTAISTLAELSRVQARHFANATALVDEMQALTYGELHANSNRIANGLLAAKVKPGSRVGLLARDRVESYEILFACAKINAVLVPLNWHLTAPEASYILRDAGVETLFVGAELYPLIQDTVQQLSSITAVIVLGGGEQDPGTYLNWRQLYSDRDPHLPVGPNDVAVQYYTSGTTGHPKGVQLPHDSFFAIARETVQHGKSWIDWNESDISLVALPLFHIGGLWWAIRGLAAGAKNVFLEAFIAHKVLAAVEQYRVTKAAMVPAMLQVLLSEPELGETDHSSLTHIVYGGSPISESLLTAAMARFSCKFVQVYGLTETGAVAVSLPATAHDGSDRKRLKSAGRPMPGVAVKILNQRGETLPCGEVGEICLSTPAKMMGYWKLPEATASTLVDGWIHTGDAGYVDEEGYVYICDRVKEMISYAGENVYPAEIENVLSEHPAVAEVGVIGVPDPRWGEAVKAIVVLKGGRSATAKDIIRSARGKLADFKLPKSIEFAASLPKTSSGKVQKRKLRERYWEGYERKVN